jgi:hypothetical protein
VSRTTCVFWLESEELRLRTAFRVFALRLRAVASLLLALERRRIAHPKAQDYTDFQNGITAEIRDRRNGLQYKFALQKILNCLVRFGSWLFSSSERALALPARDAEADVSAVIL